MLSQYNNLQSFVHINIIDIPALSDCFIELIDDSKKTKKMVNSDYSLLLEMMSPHVK